MPDKPSFNVVGAATPALVLALPVWPGAYAMGSLAEVEMAQVCWPLFISKKRIDRYILTTFFCFFIQAIQYILNAATTVQQKDGARIHVTLWCMGRSASVRGMSYKDALKCSANPGMAEFLLEIWFLSLIFLFSRQICGRNFLSRFGCRQEIQ